MPAIILDQVVDFSPMIELQDTPDTLLASLNLFETSYHATTVIEIGKDKAGSGLIPARERGGERNFLTMTTPVVRTFRIPFFPLDKNIKAQDIQSFRSFAMAGINDQLRTEAEVVNRYMTQILKDVAKTKEKIMAEALQGTAYNGGVGGANNSLYNWYTEWSATQKTVSVDFASITVSPAATIEQEARAYIIDEKQDGTTATRIVALCSREFFASLVNSPFVRQAYQYFQGTPNLLRDRLNGNMDVQVFEWNGVTYIEDIHGNIPAGEAYAFPMGISGMFQLHYAPADTPELANTQARELYTFMVSEHRQVQLQSEFSVLAVNTRPELVVKLVTA